MSILVTFNGSTYIIPETNEVGWGSNLDSYLVAIAAGALQKTGGSFTLSSELDFGASFGIKSLYYESRTANIANTGIFRLANNSDAVSYRNFANSGDLPLTVNASDQLTFNGTPIGGTGIFTANRAIVSDGSGNLSVSPTTSTEIGYVSGVTSSIQTQINGKEPSFSILPISKGGTNSGTALNNNRFIVSTGSAIVEAAAVTASRALVSDINGLPTASVTTTSELAFVSGVTSAIQTQINNKLSLSGGTLTGDLTFSSGKGVFWTDSGTNTVKITAPTTITSTYALKWPIAQGASNQYLTNDGSGNLSWTNAAGTGTVNSGTQFQLAYYATTTNAVSGLTLITASRALVSDANGLPVASATTAAELAFVSGVTSAIQTQINTKAPSANPTFTGVALFAIGSVGSPSIAFSGDTDTGIYNSAANQIDFAVGGLTGLSVNSNQQTLHRTGTVSLPSISFAGDPDTGLYSAGANDLGVSVGGILQLEISTTKLISSILFLAPDGSVTTPSYTFGADQNTGIYRSGADTLDFATGGVKAMEIADNQRALFVDGTVASPAITFITDADCGLYRIGSNNIAMTTNGVKALEISSSQAVSIRGTSTNDSAAAGFVGEYVSSTASGTVITTNVAGDVTSISLTAGDWDIDGIVNFAGSGAITGTTLLAGISTTSGNSTSGLVNGDTAVNTPTMPSASADVTLPLATIRASLSGTTTYYLKYKATFTVNSITVSGRISARRIR